MRITVLLPLVLLTACGRGRREYIVAFDRVDRGLRAGSLVTLGGLEIGEVTDIRLDEKYEVLVTVQMEKDVRIPVDSKFILDKDFLGNGSIVIEPGISGESITNGTTLKGIHEDAPTDTVDNSFIGALHGILNASSNRQDSILIELRRLNENLEKLIGNQ